DGTAVVNCKALPCVMEKFKFCRNVCQRQTIHGASARIHETAVSIHERIAFNSLYRLPSEILRLCYRSAQNDTMVFYIATKKETHRKDVFRFFIISSRTEVLVRANFGLYGFP
ncbi:MAG: hypothetical protein J6K86_06170, partial [Clostridia bacterium]|nr:hypothetical protein [Clostridia bacterium]